MRVYIDSPAYRLATVYGALRTELRYPVKLYVLNVLFGALVAFFLIPGVICGDLVLFYRVFFTLGQLNKNDALDVVNFLLVVLQSGVIIFFGVKITATRLERWFQRADGKLIEPVGRVTWKDEEATE